MSCPRPVSSMYFKKSIIFPAIGNKKKSLISSLEGSYSRAFSIFTNSWWKHHNITRRFMSRPNHKKQAEITRGLSCFKRHTVYVHNQNKGEWSATQIKLCNSQEICLFSQQFKEEAFKLRCWRLNVLLNCSKIPFARDIAQSFLCVWIPFATQSMQTEIICHSSFSSQNKHFRLQINMGQVA